MDRLAESGIGTPLPLHSCCFGLPCLLKSADRLAGSTEKRRCWRRFWRYSSQSGLLFHSPFADFGMACQKRRAAVRGTVMSYDPVKQVGQLFCREDWCSKDFSAFHRVLPGKFVVTSYMRCSTSRLIRARRLSFSVGSFSAFRNFVINGL